MEASTTDFRTFLLEAIEAGSEMMSNFFSFEGERDERQRGPTGRTRICRVTISLVVSLLEILCSSRSSCSSCVLHLRRFMVEVLRGFRSLDP